MRSAITITLGVRIGSKGEILAKSRCFPLHPCKRTSGDYIGMSERCPHANYCEALFDYLVGCCQQDSWHCEVERLSGP
jgi:hypothetical protein